MLTQGFIHRATKNLILATICNYSNAKTFIEKAFWKWVCFLLTNYAIRTSQDPEMIIPLWHICWHLIGRLWEVLVSICIWFGMKQQEFNHWDWSGTMELRNVHPKLATCQGTGYQCSGKLWAQDMRPIKAKTGEWITPTVSRGGL